MRPLIQVRDLRTYFPVRRGALGRVTGVCRAVDGVSFDIAGGTTLGLVGESGCGKTTLGRTILRLAPATTGQVLFDGVNLFTTSRKRLRDLRREMQIVFQDPLGSLDPRMTVGEIIGEPLRIHGLARGARHRERVGELLERVGLRPAHAGRYPHEFSGGQQQRIGIARALALEPRFVVCDEPVSALDVSIQAQILNLLADLQRELKLTYLFIAHNLAVIRQTSDRVAVMYLGKIVEIGGATDLYARAGHPFTRALLEAVPEPEPTRKRSREALRGETGSPIKPPSGCAFHPRCRFATEECRRRAPELKNTPELAAGHLVACHQMDTVMLDGRSGNCQ